MSNFFLSSGRGLFFELVIIEDTLSMFKEFISSQTVRKNYFPPDDNLESDYFCFFDRTRHCVHAGFVVVDILIKLVVFHEEKLVEQFGSEVFLLVEHHAEFVHIRDLTTLGLGESEHCDDVEFL